MNKSKLHIYLDECGAFGTNDKAIIEAARKAYWREYRIRWIKEKRKEAKSFTISCSRQEHTIIQKHAKLYNLSPTAMIKQASLAYLQQAHVIPDKEVVGQIRELLALNYNSLQQLHDEEKISHVRGVALLEQMATMEKRIMNFLHLKSYDH